MRKSKLTTKELIINSMKKDLNKPLDFNNLSLKSIFIGDWKNFFIFMLILFLAWGYAHDTSECRNVIQNLEEICISYVNSISIINHNTINELNTTWSVNDERNTWENNKSKITSSLSPNS